MVRDSLPMEDTPHAEWEVLLLVWLLSVSGIVTTVFLFLWVREAFLFKNPENTGIGFVAFLFNPLIWMLIIFVGFPTSLGLTAFAVWALRGKSLVWGFALTLVLVEVCVAMVTLCHPWFGLLAAYPAAILGILAAKVLF